jgi:chromosome segregation ATPase
VKLFERENLRLDSDLKKIKAEAESIKLKLHEITVQNE